MKSILITGANGFLGRALSLYMLEQGWNVRGVVRTEELAVTLPKGVQPYVIEDIGPNVNWTKVLVDIDVVVHLAAIVHVLKNNDMAEYDNYMKVNCYGSEALAIAARDAGVNKFIYLSSIRVNGKVTTSIPFSEKDVPEPTDCYATSKWEAEKKLNALMSDDKMGIVIVRPPLVYGPSSKGNYIRLQNIINKGIPLPLLKIKNKRSMIGIRNLVDFIFSVINTDKASGETFVISDDDDMTLPYLISTMSNELGKQPRLFFFPRTLMYFLAKLLRMEQTWERLFCSLQIDISKAKNLLDWVPPYSTKEEIRYSISKNAK